MTRLWGNYSIFSVQMIGVISVTTVRDLNGLKVVVIDIHRPWALRYSHSANGIGQLERRISVPLILSRCFP